jgi:hypothetical protein
MQIRKLFQPIALMVVAVVLPACTTANYGIAPASVQDKADTYMFKMYVGGFSGGETADAAVKPDIEAFQRKNNYKSYKVLDKRYNFVPSYFEYTVQFSRS